MHSKVEELVARLKMVSGFTVKVDGPTIGHHWFIDVVANNKHVCVQALYRDRQGETPYDFGFSIVDDDGWFQRYPDCTCNHFPTLVKYVKLLLA